MYKLRFLAPFVFLLAVAGFGAVVMLLWNWLMPGIFGLSTVSFWQALGLLILFRILFGGFIGRAGKRRDGMKSGMFHHGNHLREKWMKMTPEERDEFINKTHAYWHGRRFGRYDFFDACDSNNESESSSAKQ